MECDLCVFFAVSFLFFLAFSSLGATVVGALSFLTEGAGCATTFFSTVGVVATVDVGIGAAVAVAAVAVVAGVALFSANQVLSAVSHAIHFVLREPAIVCNFALRHSGIFSY